jgi:hypothetical protein
VCVEPGQKGLVQVMPGVSPGKEYLVPSSLLLGEWECIQICWAVTDGPWY